MDAGRTRTGRRWARRRQRNATASRTASDATSIAYVVTSPVTFEWLMRGHLAHMRARGYDVTAISAPGPLLEASAEREGVDHHAVPLAREISLLADLRSLVRLVAVLRRRRPTVVNAGTPKAGMLGMMAARLTGVPVRIYTLRGLRVETLNGAMGRVVALTERLTSWCATDVIAVSDSLRQTYIERGLAPATKVTVLGGGSSNGIDIDRFTPSDEHRRRIRAEHGIDDDTPVVGFVGRLVHDKGVDHLMDAFNRVRTTVPDAVLLLVGDYENGDAVDAATRGRIAADPAVRRTGEVGDTAPYYAAMDVLAMPSLREGFPNAPLEAAATEVPTVGFDATGTRDVIVDGTTGSLVSVGDHQALAHELARYLAEPELRRDHGVKARQRALDEYRREQVWDRLDRFYRHALARRVGADPVIESQEVIVETHR